MNRIRQSFDGIKSMVTNVIQFVAGNNDEPSDSSLSSGEIIECDSDCSECASENQSISMNSSSRHSNHSKQGINNRVDQLVHQLSEQKPQ